MFKFSKADRVLSDQDYGRAKKGGVRADGQALFISFVKGPQTRLGLIVSRKVGGAVKRNRIKRVIREFFRLHPTKFPKGDCVFVVKSLATRLTNEELCQQIDLVLEKLAQKI